jgi:hypothetical protein
LLKKGLIVGAAAIVAIVLAVGGASQPLEAPEASAAPCGPPSTAAGSGPADWRRRSLNAGPVGVPLRPLAEMGETKSGWLTARMSLLVAGHRFVVVSVPLGLRNRVFLYYGPVLDNEGHATTSLFGAPGYAEIEFQPCPERPRTVWPGGIRVFGRGPVRLLVTIEGQTSSMPLSLGRPTVATSRSGAWRFRQRAPGLPRGR